jgi:cellulose synthase/poly-beta-1,6-N-acetylglucosamine synthase-like glycosyltransferase
MEIIVCDGMSDDGTAAILQTLQSEIPILKIIPNEKKITPIAMNKGIENASGDYILILGAHSTLDSNYISENARILDDQPGIWCSGGMLQNVFLDNRSKNISAAMSSPFGVGSAHFRTGAKSGEVDTVAFGLYRREVFSKIGLFDEQLVRNQDDELNFRIINAGGKIWLTLDTSVSYYVRASWKKLYQQYFQYGYWKVYVNRKHGTITTARQVVPLLFVLFLITAIISLLTGQHFRNFYSFIFIAYLVLAVASAIRYSSKPKDILEIMISFFILHFSYGTGYAKGILDFMILRKKRPFPFL